MPELIHCFSICHFSVHKTSPRGAARGHAASLRGEPQNSWGCAPHLCPRRWLNLASPQLQIHFFLFFPSFPPAYWHSGSCCHFSSRRAGVCHPEPRGWRGGRGGRGGRGLGAFGFPGSPLCREVAVLLGVTGMYWMCTFHVFFPPCFPSAVGAAVTSCSAKTGVRRSLLFTGEPPGSEK